MPCKLWISNKVFVLGQLFLAVSYMVTKYCSTEKSFHLPTQLNFFYEFFTYFMVSKLSRMLGLAGLH